MGAFNSGDGLEVYNGDIPEASSWNTSSIENSLSNLDIKMDSNFAWLLCSLLSGIIWVTYITYYHSRVLGYILTRILNRNFFVKNGYMKVGSFTWSVLSGKIMFRDIIYMTNDYTLRLQDGWLIFRWWRSYVPEHLSEDLSHSDTRLSIMLNGFELHMYNRTSLYANLERIFGLEPQINTKDECDNNKEDKENNVLTLSNSNRAQNISNNSWRDLFPVIKLEVSSGRLVFGNRLIPTTLSVNVEEAHFVYSIKPAASKLDYYMHILKCVAENFKVILAPSPKYTGMIDDPPRYMGEGFVVFSSNKVDLYYYMDQPGIVPEKPEMLKLANGDIVESAPPIWGIDIKCEKGTDFSYGPWADRQREHLFKFFFPNDYQPMQVTQPAKPGERRQVQSFDIRLSTQNDATIDILFSKNKETNAVHINIEPGSYLEITLPWIVQPDGYRTKITGQLLHVEASTSLPYRTLLESETLEFNVKCHYPLIWNDHQELLLSFTGCKTTAHLIYAHKEFFQDLINDWSSKASPDLLYFVPYTWKLSWIMKEFEIITLCNNYNWIDCSSQNQENTHISFCGELFDMSFDLPFTEFLPQTIPLRFWIQGESVDMSLYVPEVRTSRNVLLALDKNAKIFDRDGNVKTTKKNSGKKWRRICQRSNGWIDCWSVPIIAININYIYHPQPPMGPPPQADITTPEKEEILLSPMRIPRCRKPQVFHWAQSKQGGQKFNPMSLAADKVNVDLEIGPSVLLVYGSWIRNFIHLKENIFGDYQSFTDMHQEKPTSSTVKESSNINSDDSKRESFDPRRYRPFEVVLSITMHDIQAHLIKNCTEKDPPCPMILLERFGLEMKKNYRETMLQVILSPSILLMSDTFTRPNKESHIGQGHLMLSGFQIRGHAMFSDEGRSLDEETIEYAWLIEVQLGKLSGKLTTPQLYHLVTSLETLLLLVQDDENTLRSPDRPRTCVHGTDVNPCTHYEGKKPLNCPSTDEIKYRMTRVSLDAVDLFLIESGTAMHMWLSPVRVSSCNLHGHRVKSGVSGLLAVVQIRQFICTGNSHSNHSNTNTNTSSSGRSHQGFSSNRSHSDDLWLEVGSVTFGPLIVEAALSLPAVEQDTQALQQKFLRLHDEETKRLWFLWTQDSDNNFEKVTGHCGCIGGCAFFGSNRNGKKFFKPSRQDIQDGINIAAFRINDPRTDPGFGQSILHENQLIFHTAPYDSCQVTVQESYFYSNSTPRLSCNKMQSSDPIKVGSPRLKKLDQSFSVNDSVSVSPSPVTERKGIRRRFSCTSAGNSKSSAREVPYFRLIESRTGSLKPVKREPDKSILTVPELETQPRSSASDSKLAVDYFQRQEEGSGEGNTNKWNEALHSFSTSLELDDKISQKIERTISITSENQSEVFYSADEDLTSARHSNSRHSIMETLSQPDNTEKVCPRLKFNSESNILPPGLYSKPGHLLSETSDRGRLISHSSDQEIHTPEKKHHTRSKLGSDLGKSSILHTSSSPRSLGGVSILQNLSEGQSNENVLLDSDTPSISSTSFISAMSSQEDNGLVNLHMQINRPIIEAPLLMSSYINHLSQLGCENWNQCTVPPGCDAYAVPGALFQKTEEGFLSYGGGNYIPHFTKITEGFTYMKMVNRLNEELSSSPSHCTKTPTHPYNLEGSGSDRKNDEDALLEEEMLSTSCEAGSRSTIIVKFKGDFDVILTPLVLESLQRFIDSLIPTVSSLHVQTVINHLQFECIKKVIDANVLKKEEYLSNLAPSRANVSVREGNRTTQSLVQSNVYQENISTQTQGVIALPRINVTLLQASVVEELTPFSALDNIHDFACVSIFAVCLNKATVKFHFEKKAKEIIQTFERPVVTPSQKKSGILTRGSRPLSMGGQQLPPKELNHGEPVYIESSERQQNETIIMVNLGKIHAQLRRLSNDSSILKDAVITAIPVQHSKVMFICTKLLSPQPFLKTKDPQQEILREDESLFHDDKLGFIMFETGFEGVSVKVVKQEHFEKGIKDATNGESSQNKEDKTKESLDKNQPPSSAGPEHLFNAIRFSSKTATSLNNFIESRTLKNKSVSKVFESNTAKTQPEEKNNSSNAAMSTIENPQQQSNISSCVIELATIWFNFAAPPRTPITRKMDYTRLDWNLLSTASPAINAWMNPSSRFASRLVHMFRCNYRRSSGVISCLMAEALEVPEIHVPTKSRYGRLTPLAKTLQEDPSCQLCSVLRKYVLQGDLSSIEASLTENHLPMLSTLRQGVIVLSRQWKNVLYTPLLLDHNYKTRHVKPLNVTFAMSESDEDVILTDGENSNEDNEITDECAVLINTEAGSIMNEIKAQKKSGCFLIKNSEQEELGRSALTSPVFPSYEVGKKKRHLPPHNMPPSSRASIVFPIINATHPFATENKYSTVDCKTNSVTSKEAKQLERQMGSNGSSYSNGVPGSNHSLISLESDPTEDLYAWMAKQQDFMKEEEANHDIKNSMNSAPSIQNEIRDSLSSPAGAYNFYPVHDSLCLLDAHLIFEPLLSALGVMPHQMIRNTNGSSNAVFDTWGSNLSLVAAMEGMRVDIVVSENGKPNDKKKKKTKSGNGKLFLDLPTAMPAFVCERIGLEVDVKKLADMTVDDMIQKQNVLYISRGQLKKHTSTRLNFSINIHYISQQVNMPLLRLLHQISSMYQNVKNTQMELKEQNLKGIHPASVTLSKDQKNESSSASDLQDHLSAIAIDPAVKVNTYATQAVASNPRSTLSPSSSLLTRPQLLAQKLRSTTKSVKGYMNLNNTVMTPMFPNANEDKSMKPQCWRTIYFLLDLYATMPETKTISHKFSAAADVVDGIKSRKLELKTSDVDIEKCVQERSHPSASTPLPIEKPREMNVFTGERTKLVVFGVARIHRTRLLAMLSGLKLEAEITNLHSCVTCRKKMKPESLECSLTGQIGRTMIVLLEGVAPNQQTVVKVTVGKSQALYSSLSKRSRDKNSGLLTVGAINIDIPQHPVVLHGMMTRGSKQLSSTLQELGVTRSSRLTRGTTVDETDTATYYSPNYLQLDEPIKSLDVKPPGASSFLEPLVMQFSIILQSLSITAALLPSLQAQYKMDQVNSSGVTGSKAKFTVDLPRHSLSFTTKLQVTEANLPSEASIELPKVHVSAEYIQDGKNTVDSKLVDGVVLREGSYLNATADIGKFEHSLTTDLLNHLVFVQKVFMKEVNEVLQKVYGGEKVVPLWHEGDESGSSYLKKILFSLVIRIKRIQLTATTPTNSAVRLETGAVEFQFSNRVENVSGSAQPNPYMKIFGKAQVDINLSLGQLLKNAIFEEAEPEFQQFAFFKTRISLRNAFQGEMVQGEDKEVVLITLKRPLVYIQPMAVDKAILVWLNYKNAYDYWNEQRSNLNKEVLSATQQVFEKVPFSQLSSSPYLGTLFLQLTVDDMGICLPLNPLPLTSWGLNRTIYVEPESRAAVVVTLESTSISACSSGSLVSKGRFVGLCIRFADDFETSLDDWKPDMNDATIMNLCVVSEGTYEVCSRTIAQKLGKENAKWFLNVQWQMEGVDIHLDVNVGKQLSALGHTLTMLTGSTEEDEITTLDYDSDEGDGVQVSEESISQRRYRNVIDSLPRFIFDPSIDSKHRSKLIEKEMLEQAKIINDLRSLGASYGTIEQEVKRLQELEALVYKDFRRDMIQKLRRQSMRTSAIKEKFGLSKTSTSFRSRSFIIPSPTPENTLEMEGLDETGLGSTKSEVASNSYDSSSRSGPSRSASLRVREASGPRVTFNEIRNICRQSSLPSADSDMSLPLDTEWTEMDHIFVDGEKVQLRKKYLDNSYEGLDGLDDTPTCSSPVLPSHSPGVQKSQEPNIDFELDVKVFINSGKCVLHTKDSMRDDDLRLSTKMKKERSCSGGMFDFPPSSPNAGRRRNEKQSSSSNRLRFVQGNAAQLVDLTFFYIPGLDVKVHYESKIENEENSSPYLSVDDSLSSPPQLRRPSNKKASLFAWITLQSIPQETIISPHILDFLEKTLEPIPSSSVQAKDVFPSSGHTMFAMDGESSWGPNMTTGNYVYASFPVDVMVYFHMEPSTFRFSCLPVSRVECMLQLPSLDIVFSSKRAEEEFQNEFGEACSRATSSNYSELGSPPFAIGGLSVTGCLSNFSVHIFHPYGGSKKSGLKEAQWSPLADSERKDSLSVNVEFVKFHLSRSRKINFQSEQQSKGSKTSGFDQMSRATIRFSTIVDIGSASFKYDMRRLTEILAFPKAWYRRTIVRRMFLGELNVSAIYSEGGDSSPTSLEEETALLQKSDSGRHILDGGTQRSSGSSSKSPMLSYRDRERLKLNLNEHKKSRESERRSLVEESMASASDQTSKPSWETLVLFAVNFTKLRVQMNMGNVMGNVMWLTKDFHSEGRLSIGSTGHKNMYIGLGLGVCNLDAKGGIVGGALDLSTIDTFVHIKEDPGTEPDHTLGLRLFALELRLDYMGTGVLMSRVSSLNVTLRDEWKIHSFKSTDSLTPTRRPAMIFMHGDLGWDQLQIMISKSTTADILKMYYKLDEFFSQQFQSSKRVFSSLQPRTHTRSSSLKKKTSRKKLNSTDSGSMVQCPFQDPNHHRHWQTVLSLIAGFKLSTFKIPLPTSGTVLGGTMELHGKNISLACFHGINFKAKSWALFSLKEPCISFATEAQEIPCAEQPERMDVHVVQTLTFSLGMSSQQTHAQHLSMATICRMTRNTSFPPQYKTLQEWFNYAFATSDIDAVERFPTLERERGTEEISIEEQKRSRTSSKVQDFNHTREDIFALPTLQLHLKTEHLQSAETPDSSGARAVVDCSFITEFEDHIFVTIDAEAFFFLHDLISSYLKEKEKVIISAQGVRCHSPDSEKKRDTVVIEDEKKGKKSFESGDVFTKDWRTYNCKTWHLEPKVKLWSWAGKSIEPYGVDYILQKLGFSHARTTIPKWMQRGFMDPLDKILAVLMYQMVTVVREGSGESSRRS